MILTKVSVDYGFLVGDGDAESRTTLVVEGVKVQGRRGAMCCRQ